MSLSERHQGEKVKKQELKEDLVENLSERIDTMLEGAREYGPNNYRVRQYGIDKGLVDDWIENPWGKVSTRVPRYFKGYSFEDQARLIVGATDPWEDEVTAYEGCRFIQVRLSPIGMRTGAVVYALVLREDPDGFPVAKHRAYEEIPYLSTLPSATSFIPRMDNFDPRNFMDVLDRYNTFLTQAKAEQPRKQ